MGICSCTSKFVIIVINLFFWIGAVLMLYAGVAYLKAPDEIMQNVSNKPGYITIAIAALLFLCGIIGIAGAFSEKKSLLGIFAVVVLATLTLLVFVSATLFVNHNSYMNTTDTFFLKQFNNYGNPNLTAVYTSDATVAETTTPSGSGSGNNTTPSPHTNVTTPSGSGSGNNTTPSPHTNVTTATVTTTVPMTTVAPTPDMNATNVIDTIQEDYHCCGFTNYTDWNTYDYWTNTLKHKGYVPSSCCNATAAKAMNQTCPSASKLINIEEDKALIYTDPCEKKIHALFDFVLYFMSWVAVAFAVLVLLGFCASIYLMCRKRSSDGFNYSSIVA